MIPFIIYIYHMDELSQKELQRILSLDDEALTQTDRDFLKARSAYLTRKQKREFPSVFRADEITPAETVESPSTNELPQTTTYTGDGNTDSAIPTGSESDAEQSVMSKPENNLNLAETENKDPDWNGETVSDA